MTNARKTFKQFSEAKRITSIADLAPKHSEKSMEIIRTNLARYVRASAKANQSGKPLPASERARKDRVDAILGRRTGLGSLATAPRQKAAREAERKARAMGESHTREELEGMNPSALRKLYKEYSAKDDTESKREAKMIADILRGQ